MPKVRPLGESAQRAQRNAQANEDLRRQIGRLRGEAGLTKGELARLLGWTYPTLKERTETHPERMTIEHLRALEAVFNAKGVPFCVVIGKETKA